MGRAIGVAGSGDALPEQPIPAKKASVAATTVMPRRGDKQRTRLACRVLTRRVFRRLCAGRCAGPSCNVGPRILSASVVRRTIRLGPLVRPADGLVKS